MSAQVRLSVDRQSHPGRLAEHLQERVVTLLSLSYIQRERRLFPNSLESENTINHALGVYFPHQVDTFFVGSRHLHGGSGHLLLKKSTIFCAMENIILTFTKEEQAIFYLLLSAKTQKSIEILSAMPINRRCG